VYADALRQAEARTDHPSRKRRRTRESPQRQPTRQLRQTAASPVNCQAADATRNKARSAAAPISTSQRRRDGGDDRRRGENPQADLRHAHDGEKNAGRRHRQQDAAVKPIAGRGASSRGESKTTSRTILANAATRANTAPTSVETEKLKPSREVRRRILKRDDSLRTSHLKRTPITRNQRPPPQRRRSQAQPRARPPNPTPSVQRRASPTTPPKTPPQTQAGQRTRRHAAEATRPLPNKTKATKRRSPTSTALLPPQPPPETSRGGPPETRPATQPPPHKPKRPPPGETQPQKTPSSPREAPRREA